jgi:hypothetical protein
VYQETTTSRLGPGGVRETQRAVRDGRTGKESITLRRGLGERERTVTRTRDASGQETADDVLKGIAAEEAAAFDREWAERASKLPPAGAFGFGGAGGRLGTGAAGRLGTGAGRLGGGGGGGMDGGAQRSSSRPLALTGAAGAPAAVRSCAHVRQRQPGSSGQQLTAALPPSCKLHAGSQPGSSRGSVSGRYA